jgi:ribonuclease VapC
MIEPILVDRSSRVKRKMQGAVEIKPCHYPAASVLETATLLEGRYGETAGRELDLFLVEANIRVVSVDREQVEVARRGWRKYGKGRHPAALNFGDCFSYALAKISGEPLLAKGNDFARTDVQMCKMDV